MRHTINWFEIAVTDIDRAQAFYEKLLGTKLKREDFFGTPNSIFPRDGEGAVTGALVASKTHQPSPSGAVLYLNANGKLDACLDRAPAAGGKVLMPKTAIGPMGFIAVIADTEGNTVGLHST